MIVRHMKRRALLTGASAAMLAGCLTGSNNGDGSNYEQCDAKFIRIDELPGSAQEEVMAAIENDEYETDNNLILPKLLDIDESYLVYSDDEPSLHRNAIYYSMTIEKHGDEKRLLLDKEYPPVNERLGVVNKTDDDLSLEVRIEHKGKQEILVEETIKLKSVDGEEPPDIYTSGSHNHHFDDVDYRYGPHRAKLRGENFSEEFTWEYNPFIGNDNHHIIISEEDIGIMYEHFDSMYCRWDSQGNLI